VTAVALDPGAESSAAVQVERTGHVVVLTISRPDAMNAINREVSAGLGAALASADADPDVRAVILTGAGERAFCAGADLKAIARGEGTMAPDHPEWGFAGVVGQTVSVPLIAAVNGYALGGGTELVLAADIAVAVEDATFGLPEVRRGLIAGAGGAFRLPAAIPQKIAYELILTGAPLNARRALELGLINRVVPRAELLATAMSIADRIAKNAPLAVRASKRLARGWRTDDTLFERPSWKLNEEQFAIVAGSEDIREGTRAFAEKRAPMWRGV
jgi:crotonobetainyl-CoA hydratase